MASQAPQSQAAHWTSDPVAGAVIDAFMLGWDITELKARLRIANELTQARQQAAEHATDEGLPAVSGNKVEQSIGDRGMLASKWRALFVQIASIHCRRFKDSTTKGTFYQPPSGLWAEDLPYLYPPGAFPPAIPPVALDPAEPQYAGLGLAGDPAVVGCDLTQFTLYDATRRALNCLILLYATSEDSLLAETIAAYQQQLIGRVPGVTANADDHTKSCEAVTTITQDAVLLLTAWESYLREQYYAGGTLDKGLTLPDGSQIPGNPIAEQNGFEAGRSLAALAWNVSTEVAVDECRERADGTSPALSAKLRTSWCAALSQHNILAAQHAVAALSTALDDAYYRASGQCAPAGADDTAAGNGGGTFNPDLPSSVCAIVNRSLDFWQRAVEWLAKGSKPECSYTPCLSANLHNALIEQSNVWQGLMTGQQKLQAYTVESIMHQLLRNVSQQFQDEAVSRIQQASKAELKRFRKELFWIASVVAGVLVVVVGIGILWISVAHPRLSSLDPNGIWSMFALGPILAGLLGIRAARTPAAASGSTGQGAAAGAAAVATAAQKDASSASGATPAASSAAAPGGLLHELGSWAGKAGSLLYSMWQAAYEQVRREFAFLNHVVGVAYPLVECFVLSSEGSGGGDRTVQVADIKTDYEFVTQVIWSSDDRKQELEDIVATALQPLRLAIGAGVSAMITADSSSRPGK